MSRVEDAIELLCAAEKLLELREYDKAEKLFAEAGELTPENPFTWFGLAKALSKNLHEATDESDWEYNKALKLADEEQKTIFRTQYAPARERQQKKIEERERNQRAEKVNNYRGAKSGGRKYLIFSAIYFGINVLAAIALFVVTLFSSGWSWKIAFILILIAQIIVNTIVAFIVVAAERQMPYYLQKCRRLTYIIIIISMVVILALLFLGMLI